MARGKSYTEEEIGYIKSHYRQVAVKDIAQKLDRPIASVYKKAWDLDLIKIGDKWTPERISFLEENWGSMTNRQLADSLGLRLTTTRTMLYKLGFKRMEMEYWTDEQVVFLRENYQSIGDKELAQIFQDFWPKNKTWTNKHIEKKRKYLQLKRSVSDRTKIRHRAIEKGTYATANLKRWSGVVSRVGTIKEWKNQEGKFYKVIRTEQGFVHYNRWLWEKTYGPIPKGKLIAYRDGNPLNCVPENLKCVDRGYQYSDNGPIRTDQKELTDKYVASLLAPGDSSLKDYILNEQPELIELKRQKLFLNRTIRKIRNEHV